MRSLRTGGREEAGLGVLPNALLVLSGLVVWHVQNSKGNSRCSKLKGVAGKLGDEKLGAETFIS